MDIHRSRLNSVLDDLNIKGSCVEYREHRHLAFYDVALAAGATVGRIERRTREIALGIKSQTAPIVQVLPRNGVVRLRVALREADTLSFDSVYNLSDMPKDYILPVLMGESDEGNRLWVDLSRHPHTLVAGTTGSGKSVFLRTLIANLAALKASGRKISLYLTDPKRVEFTSYEGKLPGLLTKVSYTYESTIDVLEYVRRIMEGRYNAMAQVGMSSVEQAPGLFESIVVIIDEVADLMLRDKKIGVFQDLVVKLAQKCRAAGIYLVLATQRPSVDVLTGIIKANFPARISFKVGQRVDSQVILDSQGAESLLGRGDAILQSPVHDRVRFQSMFVEPKNIIDRYKNTVSFS